MDVLGRMTEPHIVSAQATPEPKMSHDGETSRTLGAAIRTWKVKYVAVGCCVCNFFL
jgi:hypothetical protein